MAERIDVSAVDVENLNRRYESADASKIMSIALDLAEKKRAAIITSFGTESAVLLHLALTKYPELAVIFIDTGKHFAETLSYAKLLQEEIGIKKLVAVEPDGNSIARKDPNGVRWSYDPDGCCTLRKVEPLERALQDYDMTITGRKAFQSSTRAALRHFEIDGARLKVNPLARWDKARIDAYFAQHQLPRHPLETEGYLSVGCAPCTSKVCPGEPPRAGRWRGIDKTECGIHRNRQ